MKINWFLVATAAMNIGAGLVFLYREQHALGASWVIFGIGCAVQSLA